MIIGIILLLWHMPEFPSHFFLHVYLYVVYRLELVCSTVLVYNYGAATFLHDIVIIIMLTTKSHIQHAVINIFFDRLID